jgi:hypothetical protein
MTAGPLLLMPMASRRLRGAATPERAGPVVVPVNMGARWRLKRLRAGAMEHLPAAWMGAINKRALEARAACPYVWDKDRVEGDTWAHWLREYAGGDAGQGLGAVAADMTDAALRDRADLLAKRAQALRFCVHAGPDGEPMGAWGAWANLCDWAARHGGCIDLAGRVRSLDAWRARVCCARWWRGQLRRVAARLYERGAVALGLVGAAVGAWYCSDRAVKRRMCQLAANAAAMRASVIESARGQRMSLHDAASLSVSNRAIRRGELMTRIKGCEVWADARGLAGLFVTLTCPSRFHASRKGGGANPRFDGSTPDQAQAWLCRQWARARAALGRKGWRVMGFRVAEPHHDGCPHWHMLLWCEVAHAQGVQDTLRRYWLQDGGDEPGAKKHRLTVVPMLAGMAAGYIAKYIAKNIDDHKLAGGHLDDGGAGDAWATGPGAGDAGQSLGAVQAGLFDGREVRPCDRVDAWASLWRIRQFQAVGQPPVTVWRELRRTEHQAACAGSDALVLAWDAAHRRRGKPANWADYMRHQGGAMLRRKDYRFCTWALEKDKPGRYGVEREKWVCGVLDKRAGHRLPVTPTRRERWGGAGFSEARSADPWTRFNNCTRAGGGHNKKAQGAGLAAAQAAKNAGVLYVEGGIDALPGAAWARVQAGDWLAL